MIEQAARYGFTTAQILAGGAAPGIRIFLTWWSPHIHRGLDVEVYSNQGLLRRNGLQVFRVFWTGLVSR